MKIDCSKMSNIGDLASLIAILVIAGVFGFVLYLSATSNTFFAGFIAASITLKWKIWIYDPIEQFLETNWPFKT